MKTLHHVIYLPGLGDEKANGQDKILRLWRIFGLKVHYFKIGWADGEPFEPKLERILELVDSLAESYGEVSVIGTSAGASAAINAFEKRTEQIASVVCICGKLRNPQTISKERYIVNPAFEGSIKTLSTSLEGLSDKDKQKILSIRPLIDEVVTPRDTYIDGAKSKIIPSFGHVASIVYALTIGSFGISRFIKRQSKK